MQKFQRYLVMRKVHDMIFVYTKYVHIYLYFKPKPYKMMKSGEGGRIIFESNSEPTEIWFWNSLTCIELFS